MSPTGSLRRAVAALGVLVTLTLGACVTTRSHHAEPGPSATVGGPGTVTPGARTVEWHREAPPPVRRFAAVNRSLGDALRRAGSSCDAVAAALDAWTNAHGAEFREATAAMDAWERGAERSEARRYHERVEPDVDVRVAAGVRCDGHAGARAAFERFFVAVGFAGE